MSETARFIEFICMLAALVAWLVWYLGTQGETTNKGSSEYDDPEIICKCLNCPWDAVGRRHPVFLGLDHQKATGHAVTFSRADWERHGYLG